MKNIIVIWLLLYNTSLIAQIVCDSITKKPIENVNIISNNNLGTISNELGIFSLKYFDDFKFLSFSHLIYYSKKIEKSKIKELDTIFLNPSIVNLDEIVLKNFNAKDTLVKAIKNIPINYSFKTFNLYGFYRESVVEDTNGVSMTEVSFRSYNKGIETYSEILQGRRTENYSSFGLDLIGGISNILKTGDAVRQKLGFLNIDDISKYNFKYDSCVENLEGCTYIINYNSLNDDIKNYKKGQIFIDCETLAITQIITKIDKERLSLVNKNIDPRIFNSKKAIYMLTNAEATIKYKKYNDGKYYLSFIDAINNRLGFLKNISHEYELQFKLIITHVNNENPIKIETNYNINKGFNEQVKKIPKLEYWNENNTLLFSAKETKILNDIKNANN
ncbi:MAG: hypothetical protein ACOH1N_14970 [Lutibacter sp.]